MSPTFPYLVSILQSANGRQIPYMYHSTLYFSVNCWPSENGQGGCDVNIEYELEQSQLELQDVVITIPIP